MDKADEIESRLSGDAAETKRRAEIWRDLWEAFTEGGEDAAAAAEALKKRMDAIKGRFDEAMGHLEEKL